MTPDPSSAWTGGPLRSALAVRAANGNMGTLGLGIQIAESSYFTCAYHVFGPASGEPEPVEIYAGNGEWVVASGLQHCPANTFASEAILRSLDLALLTAPSPLVNTPPAAKPVSSLFAGPPPGATLFLRGLRESDWIAASYDGAYQRADEQWTRPVPFETARLGVVTFLAPRTAESYTGDSGGVFWAVMTRRCFALGHLIAVSVDGRRGLILHHRAAFAQIAITATVIGASE